MSRGPQPEAVAHTRHAFAEAFLQLYDGQPLERITVSAICKQAGLSRATFYRHFEDRAGVLHAAERENTAFRTFRKIADTAGSMPLEQVTDSVASFYDERADAVRVLVSGSEHERYLRLQARAMVPMFHSLAALALDLTPMQLDYVAEYIARAKAQMIEMCVRRGQEISLQQVNLLAENLVEKELWTAVALQTPLYGGPKPRTAADRHTLEYPWVERAKG